MATPVTQAPAARAPAARPNPAPAPTVIPTPPPGSGVPASEVPTWESDLASLTAEPEPAPPPPPAPAPAPAPAAPPPAPKPAEPAKPPAPAPKAPVPPVTDGRKAKLDPEELLNVEGLEDVELPENVVSALGSLDARDLRMQAAKLAKGYRTMAAQVKDQEAKLAEATKPKPDPEAAAIKERLTAAERELRHAAYLKSGEYKEKFETPFFEKLNEAYNFVKELTIDGENGPRQGTQRDFDELLEMNHQAASRQAEEMFGPTIAAELMALKRGLSNIRQAASKEVDRYRTEGERIEQQRLAEREQHRQVMASVWTRENEALPKKYPELFAEKEGDEEGNQLLRAGYLEVDRSQDPNLPLEEKLARLAAVRHRAAALPREIRRRKAAEARVAELEESLKAYEASVPAKGVKDGAPPPPIDAEEDAMAAIDRMATPVGR